jgi:hypothetical protein
VLGEAASSGQSDLFIGGDKLHNPTEQAHTEAVEALLEVLDQVEVDELTPRQALDVLDQLKQLVDQDLSRD